MGLESAANTSAKYELVGGEIEKGAELQASFLRRKKSIPRRGYVASYQAVDETGREYDVDIPRELDGDLKGGNFTIKVTGYNDEYDIFQAKLLQNEPETSLENVSAADELSESETEDTEEEIGGMQTEQGSFAYEVGQVIENASFKAQTGKNGKSKFVSSQPSRKALQIDNASLEKYDVDPTKQPITVRVVREVKPGKKDSVVIVEYVPTTEEREARLQAEQNELYNTASNLGVPDAEQYEKRISVSMFDSAEDQAEALEKTKSDFSDLKITDVEFRLDENRRSSLSFAGRELLYNSRYDDVIDLTKKYDVSIERDSFNFAVVRIPELDALLQKNNEKAETVEKVGVVSIDAPIEVQQAALDQFDDKAAEGLKISNVFFQRDLIIATKKFANRNVCYERYSNYVKKIDLTRAYDVEVIVPEDPFVYPGDEDALVVRIPELDASSEGQNETESNEKIDVISAVSSVAEQKKALREGLEITNFVFEESLRSSDEVEGDFAGEKVEPVFGATPLAGVSYRVKVYSIDDGGLIRVTVLSETSEEASEQNESVEEISSFSTIEDQRDALKVGLEITDLTFQNGSEGVESTTDIAGKRVFLSSTNTVQPEIGVSYRVRVYQIGSGGDIFVDVLNRQEDEEFDIAGLFDDIPELGTVANPLDVSGDQFNADAPLRKGLVITGLSFDLEESASADRAYANRTVRYRSPDGSVVSLGDRMSARYEDQNYIVTDFDNDFVFVRLYDSLIDNPKNNPELRKPVEPIRVENGELDVSQYTPEQLENVEGIERGVLIKNLNLSRAVDIDGGPGLFVAAEVINGSVLQLYENAPEPPEAGQYDFRVGNTETFPGRIFGKIEGLAATPEKPVVEEISIRNSSEEEQREALREGLVINGVEFGSKSNNDREQAKRTFAGRRIITTASTPVNLTNLYAVEVLRFDDDQIVVRAVETLTERTIITSEELAQTPWHDEMLKSQAQRLRQPEIQTALRLASKKIHPRSSSAEVLRRARDMRRHEKTAVNESGQTRSVEKHKHFAALGSALYREPDAYRTFNAGVDVEVAHSTIEIRNWLENWDKAEPPLVPVQILGSGQHGAIFAAAYEMYSGDDKDAYMFDNRKRIGGQFADAEDPTFLLNNRNRPPLEGERKYDRDLPGTEQSIFSLGTLATLQNSDVSGLTYVPQNVPAHVARFNAVTSTGNFATEFSLLSVESARRKDGTLVERCTYLDVVANRLHTIDTDSMNIAGGVGENDFRFAEANDVTERQFAREEEKLARGVRPAAMSFPQAIAWAGNPENLSPFKDVKKVILSGQGDGSKVAAGMLLGYEPGADRMPVALDRVEELVWVGMDIGSKEQWFQEVRGRYIQLGLEFTREEFEDYYKRITPIPDAKVDNVKVVDEDNLITERTTLTGKESAVVEISNGTSVTGDLFIGSNGFKNTLPSILNGLGEGNRDTVSVPEFEEFLTPGAYARSQDGVYELRVLNVDEKKQEVEYVYAENGRVLSYATDNYSSSFSGVKEEFEGLRRTGGRFSVPNGPADFEELIDEEGFPVGRRVKGTATTLHGPVAENTLTEEERQATPLFEKIPENTAGVFRFSRGTEIGARKTAKDLEKYDASRYDYVPERPKLTLQSKGERIEVTESSIIVVDRALATPYHVEPKEAIQLALADHLSRLELPADMDEIEITAAVSSYNVGEQSVTFGVDGLADQSMGDTALVVEWLKEVARDPVILAGLENELLEHRKRVKGQDFVRGLDAKRAIAELNESRPGGTKIPIPEPGQTLLSELHITVPVRGARADVQGLELAWVDK